MLAVYLSERGSVVTKGPHLHLSHLHLLLIQIRSLLTRLVPVYPYPLKQKLPLYSPVHVVGLIVYNQ